MLDKTYKHSYAYSSMWMGVSSLVKHLLLRKVFKHCLVATFQAAL